MIQPTFELVYCYPNSGYITKNGEETGAFLQGEDYDALEAELETLWKMVRQKKMGTRRAVEISDHLLSNYLPD